jgi:hypothetical protein
MADVKIKKPDGEWVSLKGPQGAQGVAGADSVVPGPAGADGADGADGRSVAVFDQVDEPLTAIAGDFWFVP